MSHTSVQIVADSVSNAGARITSFQVEAPRILLAEINTHRVLAKSAASSRAIPVKKRIEDVITRPFIPQFGKNRAGMQATEILTGDDDQLARGSWLRARDAAVVEAAYMDALGVHKQAANRIIEPYAHYVGVISGTEWDNFWILRDHKDADPAFQELAHLMREAYDKSIPLRTDVHLPYTEDCRLLPLADRFMVSAARCARTSYKSFKTGKLSEVPEDIQLCRDLIDAGHLSPFDHPAIGDELAFSNYTDQCAWKRPDDHRHNWGWIPFRVGVESDLGRKCRRNSYGDQDPRDFYTGPSRI